uniref:Uncharacterized protein n=1 Tax=Anguilla anguilla TaxID=7936 RepID=A0A0E9UBZ5_ANGAN
MFWTPMTIAPCLRRARPQLS